MQFTDSCVIHGCETKPPFLRWGKTADFESETKRPNLKRRQNLRLVIIKIADFVSAESKLNKNKQLIQLHSVMTASEVNFEKIQSTHTLRNE